MSSPTERTMALYREQGYTVQVVEKWVPRARVRQDLFGFIDLLAMKEGELIGIQATSTSNIQDRAAKVRASPLLAPWLSITGHRVVVIGWRKYKRAEARRFWRPTQIEIREPVR